MCEFKKGEMKDRIASDNWPYFEVDGGIKQSCRVGEVYSLLSSFMP
jgi:hypothetical protein